MRSARLFCVAALALVVACGCGFDDTLREYLSARFWLPFAKHPAAFEQPNVERVDAPFAGMVSDNRDTPLAKLREAYQRIAEPRTDVNPADYEELLAAARKDAALTPREREEVDLLDAKIDLRGADPDDREGLDGSKKKLSEFLRTARTPEFLSEARGWLGRVHYLLGEQTAAGKIYLDELNRKGSNLSRETLLISLRQTYGYDGGPELRKHVEEYFDTPEHAAFAIQLLTNPRWNRYAERRPGDQAPQPQAENLAPLLEKHATLLRSARGSMALAVLSMRAALHAGDPAAAGRLADAVPANSAVRREPDFLWMLASSHFLSREYAAAESPLRSLFDALPKSDDRKAAAAYALCGVYAKTGNFIEQIRYALWLRALGRGTIDANITDFSVYWTSSGWDLGLLLDSEAPTDALRTFIERYPRVAELRLVKYSLAVRLTRENRYAEAADLYQSIAAVRRAPRMRRLATLYEAAGRSGPAQAQARYDLAAFLAEHPDGIYFNDAMWHGLQNYALRADDDSRLTQGERERLMSGERKLRDDQEERWRAYHLLREVIQQSAPGDLRRQAATLAVQCLRRISERFGRADEIRKADIELSAFVR